MSLSESTAALSQDNILLEKVFFAGCCKNFVGTGARKISKAEIKELNISKLTEIVSDLVENSSFQSGSTYGLGICRIYGKSVDFLLEDLKKFNDEMNSTLIGVHKPLNQSKKDKTTVEQDKFFEFQNQSLELCEESEFILLFQRNIETDQYLLHEIDIPKDILDTLGVFGDELHLTQNMRDLREGPSEWDEVAQLGQSILDDHQITGGGETPMHQATSTESSPRTLQRKRRDRGGDDRPTASTPKRKTHQPYDETPRKRQRKSPSLPDGHSGERSTYAARRLFDQDGHSSPTPVNPEGRSSAARRLFEQDGQSSSTLTPLRHNGTDENGEEPFYEPVPPEGFSEPPRRSSSHQINSVPDLEQYHESMPTMPEGAELQPEQLLDDNDELELGELNDASISASTSKRPKRLRKWIDKEKQIPKPLDINNRERYIKMHTRPRGSTFVNLHQKEPAADLLSLPATRLKPRGPCSFGKSLRNLYLEMARPILHTNDEETSRRSSLPPLPRDANVNKRQRLSTFRLRDSRQRQSMPSTPGDQNITLNGDNGNNEDRDRELMPPPAIPSPFGRLPEIHIEVPSLPELDQQQQSPQRQAPGTPTRPIRPDTPAVSPRQLSSPVVPNNFEPPPADVPNDDLVNHPHLPVGTNQVVDDDSDPRSHHVIERSSSSMSMSSEMERSSLMKEDAFYTFLKDLWVKTANKVNLQSIIERRPNPIAFFRYFVFLQRLQKAGKLTMLQEIIYGPVDIVKEKEE